MTPYATHVTVVHSDGTCSTWDLTDCHHGDWADDAAAVYFVKADSEREAETKVREWHQKGKS